MARIDGTTLTFMPLRRSPASIRAAVAVLSAMLFTAVAAPGPAAASPCTLGGDLAAARDRPPSPCSHFALGNGARTLGPIAAGPGDGVTVAVAQGASQFVERVAGGGGVSRIPLPGAVATVYGLDRDAQIRAEIVALPPASLSDATATARTGSRRGRSWAV